MTSSLARQRDLEAKLPPIVQRYVDRVLPRTPVAPWQTRITQLGSMWQRPGSRALSFEAQQSFAVRELGFQWRARISMYPLIWLDVVDAYANGHGELTVKLWGRIRVMRERTPETTIAQAQRALSELPWNPFAIVHNPALQWHQIGERRVEVQADAGGRTASVDLLFDHDGNIWGVQARRPHQRSEGRLMPWGGRYSSWSEVGGIRIPTRAQVWWDLPEGRHVYWRGRVTSLSIDPSRSGR